MKPQPRQKKFIRIAQAAAKLGISKPTFYRYVRDVPDFPKIIKLSDRVSVLDDEELDAFVARKIVSADYFATGNRTPIKKPPGGG
jgi:predicted DNA-binding transcriptional regulator AlpA